MLQFLQRIFSFIDTRTDLERFIENKKPQNAAEVENLMMEWARVKGSTWL